MYADPMLGELSLNTSLAVLGYIDAGSGSYLLAAIASGAAGTWFFIRSKFSRISKRKSSGATSPEADAAPNEQ